MGASEIGVKERTHELAEHNRSQVIDRRPSPGLYLSHPERVLAEVGTADHLERLTQLTKPADSVNQPLASCSDWINWR
jgi:hypothetical protein